jgi:hypothetical protein
VVAPQNRGTLQHQLGPVAILKAADMHHDKHQQPQRIDQDAAFTSVDFLAGIEPRVPVVRVAFTVWLSITPAEGSGSRREPGLLACWRPLSYKLFSNLQTGDKSLSEQHLGNICLIML